MVINLNATGFAYPDPPRLIDVQGHPLSLLGKPCDFATRVVENTFLGIVQQDTTSMVTCNVPNSVGHNASSQESVGKVPLLISKDILTNRTPDGAGLVFAQCHCGI